MLTLKNYLRSRLARRMFATFFLAVLLPVVLLCILSTNYVNQQLYKQAKQHLQETNLHLNLIVNKRLQLLTKEFSLIVNKMTAQKKLDPTYQQWFRGIAIVDSDNNEQILNGYISDIPKLDETTIEQLNTGQPIARVVYPRHHTANIYLFQQMPSSPNHFVATQVNNAYLWDLEKILPESAMFTVINYRKNLLGYSAQTPLDIVTSLKKRFLYNLPKTFRSSVNSEKYLTTIDTAQLNAPFKNMHWLVLVTEPSSQAFMPAWNFLMTFTLPILLSIFVVLLASIIQIRRILVPLYKLKESMFSVAKQNFHERVDINTGDEFQTLAESFNIMTTRLGKQFNTLQTMSQIDRIILSMQNTDKIIETILLRMGQIAPCDTVSAIVADYHNEYEGHLYYRPDQLTTAIDKIPLKFENKDLTLFRNHPDSLLMQVKGALPHYLRAIKGKHKTFLLLPSFLKEKLSAIIVLGFNQEPNYTHDDLIRVRDLAHHVTVALANAAWENSLQYKAHYDMLTKLPNRILFQDRLLQAIKHASRDNTIVALMFLDLDKFKEINDTMGHAAGDEVLIETAQRIQKCIRSIDTASRLGGDEFTVILSNLKSIKDVATDVTNIAHKLITNIAKPYLIEDTSIHFSASIGIALYPQDADDFDNLIRHADSAMYIAKESGRNNYRFHNEDLNTEAKSLLILTSQLEQAIENNELEMHYQPRARITSGKIIGAEALIRWQHPERGLLGPNEFIKLAEESNLISVIGKWTLLKACEQAKAWQLAGFHDFKISVNLSPKQFNEKNLLVSIEGILKRTLLEPKYLEIEITESTLMTDIDQTKNILRELQAMGITIAIDDFGVGYSSLSYLKQFPINTLKIDKSFVANLVTDKNSAAIITAIINLAHSLKLSIVAEGIESEDELKFLQEHACDEGQGYLYSRPLSGQAFLTFLESHR